MISQVGNWLTLVAQSLLVLKVTGSGWNVGVLTACQFLPVLLFGPWAGLVADRSDKRKLLMIVQVFAMAQSFALAALAFMDHPPLNGLYAVAFCGGLAMAFDNPARRSIVVEMVDEDRVNNAVSLNSALMTSSRIVGPALAGLLISTVGYGWCFLADGITYVAVLVGYGLMNPDQIRRGPVPARGKGQVRAGLRYVWSVADLRVPLLMMAIIGTLAFNFSVVMPLLVKRTFAGSDTTFTILFSVVSVGSLVGALLTARRKQISLHHVVVSSALFGASMLLLAISPSLGWSFPAGLLVGGGSIAFLTASTAIVQVRADPAMRGRVLALQAMVFLGSTPIGGPILGALSDAYGPRWGVAVGGFASLAAALYGWLAARSLPRGEFDEELATQPSDAPLAAA
jgi:MFS family permease